MVINLAAITFPKWLASESYKKIDIRSSGNRQVRKRQSCESKGAVFIFDGRKSYGTRQLDPLLNVASESLQGQASFPALDRLSCEDNGILKVVSLASNDQERSGVEKDKVKDGVARRLELVVE